MNLTPDPAYKPHPGFLAAIDQLVAEFQTQQEKESTNS